MADERCVACRHLKKSHGPSGCRQDGCECEIDGEDITAQLSEPVVFPGPMYPPAVAVTDPPVVLQPSAARLEVLAELKPSRRRPASGVIVAYPSFLCERCSARRFDAFSCCGRPATAVTVTIARREAS